MSDAQQNNSAQGVPNGVRPSNTDQVNNHPPPHTPRIRSQRNAYCCCTELPPDTTVEATGDAPSSSVPTTAPVQQNEEVEERATWTECGKCELGWTTKESYQ